MYECPTKVNLVATVESKMELFLTIVDGFLPLTIIKNIDTAGVLDFSVRQSTHIQIKQGSKLSTQVLSVILVQKGLNNSLEI